MILMKVLGLTLDSSNNMPILVLQQENGSEILPIWIGSTEALSISAILNGTHLDRPMTHETMFQAIHTLGGEISSCDLTALRDGTYYAELQMIRNNIPIRLDCRPSDGIAMALHGSAPIRVAQAVLSDTMRSRDKRRGEDMVTSFVPDATDEAALVRAFPGMEPASRYKM